MNIYILLTHVKPNILSSILNNIELMLSFHRLDFCNVLSAELKSSPLKYGRSLHNDINSIEKERDAIAN